MINMFALVINGSETINSMSSKMLELNFIVLRMILESFGIEKYYDSQVANTANVFRLMKYKVPPNDDAAIGLVPHTDKNILTLLFQNDVQGLEVLTKEGNWVQVEIPEGSFVVMVGDALKVRAWFSSLSFTELKMIRHLLLIFSNLTHIYIYICYCCAYFNINRHFLFT